MIKIESLDSLGINTIHQIQREAFQSYRQFFSIFPPLWETLDDLKDYLRGKEVLVTWLDETPRGFLTYFLMGKICIVDRICLPQSTSGMELLSALINTLVEKKEFFREIYLEIPLPLSEMITYFLNRGFTPQGLIYRYSPDCPFIALKKKA
jgi:hypothetical protein